MRSHSLAFLTVASGFLLACSGILEGKAEDRDEDGFAGDEDCDDHDAAVNPDAEEVCDDEGVDENCNGKVNADDPETLLVIEVYDDKDEDGFGDPDTRHVACNTNDQNVMDDSDCDDENRHINPDAQEICDDDDVDEDCDGEADDADNSVSTDGMVEGFEDQDGDGFGDDNSTARVCDLGSGWIEQGGDCDPEDAATNPDALELCNGIDDNCDGDTDGDDAADASTWYRDRDLDGYGDAETVKTSCEQPASYVTDDRDCDDFDADVHPTAFELCNGNDDDCDGEVDPDSSIDAGTWYLDSDDDGYGRSTVTAPGCDAPTEYTALTGDCDDNDATRSPGKTEVCDAANKDEDCDGLSDNDDSSTSSSGRTTYYADADADGYGSASSYGSFCDHPSGYVTDRTDCDDANSARYPSASEVCDSANTDEDCDGNADDSDSSVGSGGKFTFYIDSDGDGYGAGSSSVVRCDKPAGYARGTSDCNDADAAISPGDSEICDASDTDEDCDGMADDDDSSVSTTTMSTWYLDTDGDGYGDTSTTQTTCDAANDYVATSGDCDDATSATHPGATETCRDNVDDDCNGSTSCAFTTADADTTIEGKTSSDSFGAHIVNGGDLGVDGYDDLLVGAINEDQGGTSAGAAYIIAGHQSGSMNLATTAPGAKFMGEDSSDYAGSSVSAGDVDDDGDNDAIIGAYADDTGASGGGAVYLMRAPFTAGATVDLSSYWAKYYGASSSDYAGDAVANGDFSADGETDLLIGSYGYSSSKGVIYMVDNPSSGSHSLSTTATATLTGESSSNQAGRSLAAGDFDGDGYDDALIGASAAGTSSAGKAYIVDGPFTGSIGLASADVVLTSTTAYDYLGMGVATGGDVDGDGRDDLMVGAAGAGSYGQTYVFIGQPVTGTAVAQAEATLTQDDTTSSTTCCFGRGLANAGDLDDDGYDDVAVGDSYAGSQTGRVYIFTGVDVSGAINASDATFVISDGSSGSALGNSLAILPNWNGDAYADLAIGASGDNPLGVAAGAAYVFQGDAF